MKMKKEYMEIFCICPAVIAEITISNLIKVLNAEELFFSWYSKLCTIISASSSVRQHFNVRLNCLQQDEGQAYG